MQKLVDLNAVSSVTEGCDPEVRGKINAAAASGLQRDQTVLCTYTFVQ